LDGKCKRHFDEGDESKTQPFAVKVIPPLFVTALAAVLIVAIFGLLIVLAYLT
jgi:hypothetical protein